MNWRSLLNRLTKSRNTRPSIAESHRDSERELGELRRAFEVDHAFYRVITMARPLLESEDAEVRREANKYVGLSMFRTGQYREALTVFRDLAQNSSESKDWFNVVTAATKAGEIEVGETAFDKAVECQHKAGNTQQPSVPFMRYWYACCLRDRSEYSKALHQIDELRQIYEHLETTDDTFVYIRGVPFLAHTMDVAVDIFKGLGDLKKAIGWIDDFAEKLDDEGQQYLADVRTHLMNEHD